MQPDQDQARDVEAIARTSAYVKHGTTILGGGFRDCLCLRTPCRGVADNQERDDCPVHQTNPVQRWHWASECPGPR